MGQYVPCIVRKRYALIFKCSEKTKVGVECDLSTKWLSIIGEVTYRSVVKSSAEVRSVRQFLYNVRCKFENKTRNIVLGVQEEDRGKLF